jgi:tetratricopeptide (TPR) repeat protein
LLLNQIPEAEDACHKSIELLERLVADFKEESEYRHLLCKSHAFLGHVFVVGGRYVPGYKQYEMARQLGEKLVEDHPDRTEYLVDLTDSLTSLGNVRSYQDPARAEALFRRAVKFGERAVRQAPAAAEPACRLATAYHGLGELLHGSNRLRESSQAVRRGLELLLPADRPAPVSDQDYRWVLPSLRLLSAQLAVKEARPEEAETQARQTVLAQEALARRHSQFFVSRVNLEPAYTTLGEALWMLGKEKEADAAWQKAGEHGRRMAKDFPTFPRPVGSRDQHLLNTLLVCARARWDVPRVVAAADRLAKRMSLPGLRLYDLACVYALAAAATKDDPSEEYARRAIAVLQRPAVVKELRSNARLLRHAEKTDRDLDPLRGRSDFREWLVQCARKTKE